MPALRHLVRLWFGLDEPVSRADYAASGFGLMAFKYAVELLLIHAVSGRWLSPAAYVSPLVSARAEALAGADWLLAVLVVWTLPFLWIGVSMTMRRAEHAGCSPFFALLYFVPVINYVLMLALCLLPRSAPVAPARGVGARAGGGHALRSVLLGVALALGIALALVATSVLVFGAYGTTLFLATPFVMGATSAYVFNRDARHGLAASLGVAALGVFVAGGALLSFALEGVLCLAMAAPVGLTMALMGALLGRTLALRDRLAGPGLAAVLVPLPLLAGLDARRPATPPIEVLSVVEVDAPPNVVWRNVVDFPELPEPSQWYFRSGIAYPRRATLAGRGPGAVRRCEFSTGAFVEPITVWQEQSRLAFDVAEQPPPLHEWSPYRHVIAPHLDGYLHVRNGEFRLHALPGGRTRLEGRTYYDVRIFPAAYWSLWSDALVHAIHRRVLGHVKALSEGPQPAA